MVIAIICYIFLGLFVVCASLTVLFFALSILVGIWEQIYD